MRALDRGEQARLILAEQGPTYLDSFGAPRTRPEVAVERDSRLGFARLLAQLDLDVPPVPPMDALALRSRRRR